MNIAIVLASQGAGGLERHVLDLSRLLTEEGHRVTVISNPSVGAELAPAVRFVAVDFERGRWHPLLLRDLLRALRAERFDLIHAQANKAAALVSTLKPWLGDAALVGSIHNLKKRTRMFRRLDRVIGVSKTVAEFSGLADVAVVYNGIDYQPDPAPHDKAYLCAEFDFDVSRPLLLTIGRLVPAKGIDVLLEAVTGCDANFLIVGDGPLRDSLHAKAKQLGVTGQVAFAGFRRDVPKLLPAADGVVISSRREGHPYVFVETARAHRPIVSTQVPAGNELLPANLLAPVDDPGALRAVIQQAIADFDQWRQWMAPVFKLADEQFTLEAMTANTELVYREALAAKGRPHATGGSGTD